MFGRRIAALLAALAFCGTAQAEPRPFRLDGGRVVAQVMIEGREVAALIDTGAWGSSISETLADELNLRAGRSIGRTYGASGQHIPYKRAYKVAIDLGGGVTDKPGAAVTPARPAGTPQATIGMDVLRDAAVVIDFERMTIDFIPSRRFTGPPGAPLKMEGWWRTVRVDLGGTSTLFTVDTAASSAMHVMLPEFQTRRLLDGRRSSLTLIEGIDGLHQQTVASMPEVRLGGVRFENVPFTVADTSVFAWGSGSPDGVIGVDLLRRFHVVLDFGRRQAWLTPNGAVDAPFRRNRIGLVNAPDGVVRLVAPGSPAEAAGLKAGDTVLRYEDDAGAHADVDTLPDGAAVHAVTAAGERRRLVLGVYY